MRGRKNKSTLIAYLVPFVLAHAYSGAHGFLIHSFAPSASIPATLYSPAVPSRYPTPLLGPVQPIQAACHALYLPVTRSPPANF